VRSHRSLDSRSRLSLSTPTNSSSDLTRDASIRYASDSIAVVLGYQPLEVLDRSCWDYFHPQELPFARSIHTRGVRLDKAAVLNYCSIRHKNRSWVGCECVFTVVYDVLIASTTVYGGGKGSQSKYFLNLLNRRSWSPIELLRDTVRTIY
jgi:PAS domain-containing protein